MCNKNGLVIVPIIVLATMLLTAMLPAPMVSAQDESDDPVLDFYCERARAVYRTHNPFDNGATFSFRARSWVTELKQRGKEVPVDSSLVRYYYSSGNLDSQQIIMSTSDDLIGTDFSYPNLFDHEYDFSFFPNDAGGEVLAIGVDADTARGLYPVGIAVIDRNRYFLRRLYLYYPDLDRYERYSQVISFLNHGQVVFPDTVQITYAKAGVLSTGHFRLQIIVDSLVVIPR